MRTGAGDVGDARVIAVVGAVHFTSHFFQLVLPPLFPLLRIGVHGGPVVQLDGSYFGTPLNLTARLAARARPDQILCTERIARSAGDLPDVRFRRWDRCGSRTSRRPSRSSRWRSPIGAAGECSSIPSAACGSTRSTRPHG